MPVDVRREIAHINKEYEAYHRVIGEEVVWFRFDSVNSRWDDTYDEGGRRYLPGIRLPALWVDQIEDPEQYSGEGRRPRQRIRFAVSAEEMKQRGVGAEEVHGRRLNDQPPDAPFPAQAGRPLGPWLDDRLNDVVYYDHRYYSISNFQVRGRAQYTDAIVGVSGLELIPDDESIYDFFPDDTQFGDPLPPDTLGMPLLAFNDQDNVYYLSFESYNLTGSTWTLRLYSGTTQVGTMAVNSSQLASGTVVATLSQSATNALPADELKWMLTQQFGLASSVVLEGTLYVLDSLQDALELEVTGDNVAEIDLEAVVDSSAVWTLWFDTALSEESTWQAVIEDDGEVVASFVVDSSSQATGTVVLLLPESVVDSLDEGTTYVWKVFQTVPSEPPLLVLRGTLTVQES